VGPNQLFAGQLVELVGQPFGQSAGVAEDDRRVVFADQLEDRGWIAGQMLLRAPGP